MLRFTPAAFLISVFMSQPTYSFAQGYINTEYSAGAPDIPFVHGPWNCLDTGWDLDTLYIPTPKTSCFHNTGKMKDSIFLPCLLPVLCLKHHLGKRNSGICTVSWCHETLLSAQGRIYSHPLWKWQGLCPPASSKRLRKVSASALKESLSGVPDGDTGIM